MKRLTKFLMAFALVANLILLTGCIWPHSEPRSQETWGKVLDAKTHLPIQGAKVYLMEPPQHAVYTDKNGYFHMKATRNFFWARVPPGDDWPSEKTSLMGISHTNYVTTTLDGTNGGDFFLQPKQ